MALRFEFSVVFPRTAGLRPEDRAEIARVRRDSVQVMRAAMNELRQRARAAAPVATRRLQRGIRVRRARASEPGAVTFEMIAPAFYAAATNARGRASGWWTGVVDDPEAVYEATDRIIDAFTPVYADAVARAAADQLVKALASVAGGVVRGALSSRRGSVSIKLSL